MLYDRNLSLCPNTEGCSVALSENGDTLVAGGYENNGVGGVFVYFNAKDGWVPVASLSQNAPSSQEGSSVAIAQNGSVIITGAPAGQGWAQIYVIKNNFWTSYQRLSQNLNSGEGISVALSSDGNTCCVGAPIANNGAGSGIIYVQ